MSARDALDLLKHHGFVDLCQRNDVALAILFGSASKGGTTPGSDIDLAVSLRQDDLPADRRLRAQARRRLVRDLSVYLASSDLDVVILNGADPLLRFEIAEGGRPLYEERPGLFADFCSLAVRQHEDAKVFYRATDRYLRQATREGGTEP